MKKKASDLEHVNHAVLQVLHPEHVEVEICRSEELDQRRGLTSELDEMWSFVQTKANQRWLWHAIDHHSGHVLAYVFGRRKDTVFLQLRIVKTNAILLRSHPSSSPRLWPPVAAGSVAAGSAAGLPTLCQALFTLFYLLI